MIYTSTHCTDTSPLFFRSLKFNGMLETGFMLETRKHFLSLSVPIV
jgi:hypothetical protein